MIRAPGIAAAAAAAAIAGLAGLAGACGEPIAVVGDSPGIMRIVAGIPDMPGESAEDLAVDSRIRGPTGLAMSSSGTLFIAERLNVRIISVASDGALDVVGDRPCAVIHCLQAPTDAALDPQGRLIVADEQGHQIWRVDVQTGTAEVVAGNGFIGPSADGTPALEATLQGPRGVAVDVDGTIYFSERVGHRVRFIDASGALRTLAGTGVDGFSGDGGPANQAEISTPGGLDIAAGVLYLADSGNDRIRAIDLDAGTIETVAGNGIRGYTGDGIPATEAALNFPEDVAATADGRRIFIADTRNHRIRHVAFDTDLIETFAGTGEPEFTGNLIDAGAVSLDGPSGVTTGPFGFLFVADPGHAVVWRVVLGF